ncbi:Rieske (2Fe-2S) protein [Pyrobaculum ferrireducens]|uniref:Rieske iron sulfur protein, putative n=1 Tax=Pyrobaculum ferrireducens TaxID=1104324 RepID=G7VBY5_9CREN|nr:Rieske 2Fe-2S domain-containing protein [Pyrobaculum ferrireducens]AET32485.1 Rieske iron sulfur protein, putative [Pyrobaculum ferrireducens]
MPLKIRELPEGVIVPVPGTEVFAVRRGNEVHVYRDECPHAYCNFTTSGLVEGDYLICTCHWCRFDLRTVASLTPELTAEPLKKLRYRIEGDELVAEF